MSRAICSLALGAAAAVLAACSDSAPTSPAAAGNAPARGPSLDRATPPLPTPGGKPIRFPLFNPPGTFPAGVACSFPVAVEFPVIREVVTAFPPDENGDVVLLITGTLVTRFTNVETGKSITRNSSGPGRFIFHADGSVTLEFLGLSWTFLGPSDIPAGPTLFLNSGRMVVNISPTGQMVLVSRTGHLEDLCAALS